MTRRAAVCRRAHDRLCGAFSTSVLQPRPRNLVIAIGKRLRLQGFIDHYRFFPAWTSAMRRLVRYRARADRPQPTPDCRALPPPIVDPVS